MMTVNDDEKSADQIGVIVVTLCMIASLSALTLWFATQTDVARSNVKTSSPIYEHADLK
jgi:hypothetical protein